MDEEVYTVEDIFERDTPLSEGILGLSEGPTLSPITMLRRYMAEKELKKQKENAEETLDELEMSFADGGMAGDKTYHQVRDQFMPMDSESMGYAYGGGVGSMMQPRMNFAGGGGDFQPLGYDEDESITVEDFSESFSPPMYRPVRSVGGVKLKEMPAGVDQSGIIDSAPSITNRGVRTMEGSLIDGDDPSSRYGVQQDFPTSQSLPSSAAIAAALGSTGYEKPNMRGVAGEATMPYDRDFSKFDEARMGKQDLEITDRNRGQIPSGIMSGYTQPSADYPDMIRNPENFPNRLQNLERDAFFENTDFYNDDGIYTKQKGESILAENRKNPLKNFLNKDTNMFGYQKKPTGPMTGIMEFMGKIPTPMNLVRNIFNRDPNAPSYQTYDPTGKIDYSKLNTTNLNDFYDSNEDSDTFGTTRFDRAKPGSFASFRTLADYFNRNKKKAEKIGITRVAAEKKAQEDIKAAERQAVLNARQAAADRSRQSYNPGNIGGGSYRSDRDNSRDGGYGGSSKRSEDNRSSDLGFSDIRLKDNIELVGKSPSDINIYNFTYLNDSTVYQGVMAQEVPWASVKHDNGYLMVDYNKVDVDFKRQ